MCGLVGFLSINLNKVHLEKMTQVLVHRGPDAEGYFFDHNKKVGLGHQRLSVLDLSVSANQPFYSSSKRFIAVYNGEVYNFKEIRDKIIKESGATFNTNSDTEVIIEAFALWGTGFIHQLNGMFAIAIWDNLNNELHLFRDRMGIKPLFYYWDEKQFIFGSEIKAFQVLPISLRINERAIPRFLHLGYIPQPDTIYENVFKFPSGQFGIVKWNNGQIDFKIEPYWNIEEKISSEFIKDETAAKMQLSALIEDSVKQRLISDVPIGTFLSGGIDSSLVTAFASGLVDKPLQTFTVGFKENRFDESIYARRVAKHLNTDHHQYILSEKEALSLFEEIITTYDEPFADTSAIPTMLVSKLAKEKATVILTGDGGDELFHGYGMYNWANRFDMPGSFSYKGIGKILKILGNNRWKRIGHLLDQSTNDNVRNHIFSQEQYLFSNRELKNDYLLNDESGFNYKDPNRLLRNLKPAEYQALFDLKYYLKDDLLVKVDRASMKYSLECRIPLLDHRIVEFALNLSPRLKMKNGVRKYLLKKVLFDKVPQHLFDRPKRGFAVPLAKWLKNELHYFVDDYLNKKWVNEVGIVKWENVRKLISSFEKGEDYLYNRVWTIAYLHRWMKENG